MNVIEKPDMCDYLPSSVVGTWLGKIRTRSRSLFAYITSIRSSTAD